MFIAEDKILQGFWLSGYKLAIFYMELFWSWKFCCRIQLIDKFIQMKDPVEQPKTIKQQGF